MGFLTEPVVAVLLSIALGHLVGRVRLGPVAIGGVCGTLFVALVIGQVGVRVPDDLKDMLFALFIYALGFTAGPQFFENLRGGVRLAIFPVIEVVVALGLTLAAVVFMRLDAGTAAGLFAGSATESALLGTASEAIDRLGLTTGEAATLQANMATAYSLTYLFGLVGIVVFLTQIAPLLLGRSLREEAVKLARELGADHDDGEAGLPIIVERAFEVGAAAGQTPRRFEEQRNWTVAIVGVQRAGALLPAGLDFRLEADDILFLRGRRNTVLAAGQVLGREVPVPPESGFAAISRDVVLSRKDAVRREARELRQLFPPEMQRGVFLTRIRRMGQNVPALPRTILNDGDVLTLYGAEDAVARAAGVLGSPLPPEGSTDFVILGLGIVAGLLIGHVSVALGPVELSLGLGGGALLSGLVFGWLNMRRPRYGSLPGAAADFAKNFGLSAFIAAIGLGAGPDAIAVIRQYGLLFPVLGVVLSVVPALVSLLVGERLLRLPMPILLGAIAGQHCSTPAISALVTQAGNSTPVIGYTVTYALANVLLPLMGPIVVGLVRLVSG